jgi:hypothetical protein
MHMRISLPRPIMKTERVTLLTSPEFKAFLNAEARRERISVGRVTKRPYLLG